jgi:hypothetical protein
MDSGSTIIQQVVAGSGAAVQVNDNFASASPASFYARDPVSTTGLTWGYVGGRFASTSVASGTVALTASNTNYVVAAIASGAVSAATTTTNWNDSSNYIRLYKIVAGSATVTSYEDHRQAIGAPLPIASATVLGGIKIGAGLAVAPDGTASATGSAPNTASMTDFAQDVGGTSALNYAYQAGKIRADNVTTAVVAGGIAVTNNTTNYVEITGAGVVSTNTSGFTSGRYPMAVVVTSAGAITGVTDKRGVIALGGVQLSGVNAFTKNQSVTPSALTSGATVNTDASLSNNFKLVLATNATLANPTNLTDGMVLNYRIKQDATGSRTLAYGSKFKFPGGSAPVLSTAANAVDLMSCYYDSTDDTLSCVMSKGFA